jgi:hypothetical protein
MVIRVMKASVKSARDESTTNKTIEAERNRTATPYAQAPRRADEPTDELLRRVESGQPLTLAEYVRAEEALAPPSLSPARDAGADRTWRFKTATAHAGPHASAANAGISGPTNFIKT